MNSNKPENTLSVETSADKSTVWVNYEDGSCIGRFSKRFGIDIHTTATEQMQGKGQCLYCTHHTATYEDWLIFCEKLKLYYSVKLDPALLTF